MIIFWGPELVQFYNAAYRPILRRKHPAAFGQRARDCFPEIWHEIGPMFQGVLASGKATWSDDLLLVLDRNGFSEECRFTFSYSPILDGEGRVEGVFCAVTETTPKVQNERRLRTLHLLEGNAMGRLDARETCRASLLALGTNKDDIPYAVIYEAGPEGGPPRVLATLGVERKIGSRMPRATWATLVRRGEASIRRTSHASDDALPSANGDQIAVVLGIPSSRLTSVRGGRSSSA